MAEPFLSEIRIMSFVFRRKGWALCNGQLLPINQNQALFSLLGTTFGGDGRVNFALPDLRGRDADPHRQRPHPGRARRRAGAHADRSPRCPRTRTSLQRARRRDGDTPIPAGNVLARRAEQRLRGADATSRRWHPATIANVGGSQAHLNMQPFLTLNFCIALQGIFPSPN